MATKNLTSTMSKYIISLLSLHYKIQLEVLSNIPFDLLLILFKSNLKHFSEKRTRYDFNPKILPPPIVAKKIIEAVKSRQVSFIIFGRQPPTLS